MRPHLTTLNTALSCLQEGKKVNMVLARNVWLEIWYMTTEWQRELSR